MKDTRKFAELLRYSSPMSIMVVTWNNRLKELACPFEVEVLEGVGNLSKGAILKVERVKISASYITVFIIDDNPYYYKHFSILIG